MRLQRIAPAGGLALLLVSSAAVAGSAPAKDTTVRACVELGGAPATRGDIKIRKGEVCPAGTRPISWALAGARGPAGPRGPAGAPAPLPAKGEVGPAGPRGEPGATGAAGATGPAGAGGPPGADGPPGLPGATGPAGPKGDTGETGATGAAGPKGDTGPAGATGPAGPAGEIGAAGPAGDTGPAGPKGDTGAVGPAGPKGDTGAAGPTGPKGDTGATGAMGPAGPADSQIVSSTAVSTVVNAVQGVTFTATASCPAGKKVLGGGGRVSVSLTAQLGRAALKESYPSGASSWTAVGVVTTTLVGSSASITASAVCTA